MTGESACALLMDYQSKNHVKFLILYHLIFVCKYRKKLLVFYGAEMPAEARFVIKFKSP